MTEATGRDSTEAEPARPPASVPLARGLSAKLLVLTILFVMLAEVLIFVPSVANYRIRWLEERLSNAAAIGLVLVESGSASLDPAVQEQVLMALGARVIAVRDEGTSRLLVVSQMPPQVDVHIDLQEISAAAAMRDALDTLLFGGQRVLRVFGQVAESDKEFEILIDDRPLRRAMLDYSRNIAILSLIISLITAGLVFYAINMLMIRPIRMMTLSMLEFARSPEHPDRIIRPGNRSDELGVAARELARMQEALQRTLRERKHLADLGLAVSKINHDMRNVLTSAQLLSERLRSVDDATVQRFLPKLVRALDRAVSYSQGVLAYGRTQEAPPARRRLRLRSLVEEVFELLSMDASAGIALVNSVEGSFEVDADPEQLFRVLANLGRNAVEAMSGDEDGAVVRRLTVLAERSGGVARIIVEDTGPGLPQKALDNLFAAFRGSARSGGTGLGLAIARELVAAHGGNIELLESRGGRTAFALNIPDQPIDLEEARGALRRRA